MWGQIMVEASNSTNFNFGFSTYKSEILIHLSQWQYWWWFWFSLVWTLYYYITIKNINSRTLNFNPMLNTSFRSHGKWGDFLIALIPLSWCGNILVNSNFILRMIEWQNESSLFTIRVQGKQWYWVYKYDITAAHAILNAPKNIGNNNWLIMHPNEWYTADSYYQAMNIATESEMGLYCMDVIDKLDDYKNNTLNKHNNHEIIKINNNNTLNTKIKNIFNIPTLKYNKYNNIPNKPISINTLYIQELYFNEEPLNIKNINLFEEGLWDKFPSDYSSKEQNIVLDNMFNISYNWNPEFNDNYEWVKSIRSPTHTKPLELLCTISTNASFELLKNTTKTESNLLFNLKFNDNENIEKKIEHPENIWGFRQKKIKKLSKIKFKEYKYTYSPITYLPIKIVNNLENLTDRFNFYLSVRNNKHRSETIPVTLARRLLRTKRTLVLPAHINLTVVTNSYDVVHSWFIPGLGIKLDCVPGRSTHHTFYIDNIGFYYGQCAEICGRYHHHMPIRLCALPFEQFLLWWQTRGLHRVHRLSKLEKSKLMLKFH